MPPLKIRTRPYKDFMTPALHRRFSSAAAIALTVCYLESILTGPSWKSLFWSWFPLGMVGIRALLLFICAFVVLLLRVAQLHAGSRTTPAPIHTFIQDVPKRNTLQTPAWYLFSAWLWSEIYIFSAPASAELGWITTGKHSEHLPRLNEKPIFLMTFCLMLALSQSVVHLFYDYDRVNVPINKPKTLDQAARLAADPMTQFRGRLPKMVLDCVRRPAVMFAPCSLIYHKLVRKSAWSWTLTFAKVWWSLPKSRAIPNQAPYGIGLICHAMYSGFLLVLMWEITNAAFSVYVAQEPLKNDRPITYESKDPNGSLITGLRGVKLQTKLFAYWELAHIAQHLQGRRKQIFDDIDRPGGTTWSQILALCITTIKGIDERIEEFENPSKPILAAINDPLPRRPKVGRPPKSDDSIFTAPPPSKIDALGKYAQKYGNVNPGSPIPKQIENVAHLARSALPADLQEVEPLDLFQEFARKFLGSFLGYPFRQTYRRRAAAVVLGQPYGEASIIVDAIDAISRLSVVSMEEDSYGNVQRDLPLIIRTYTNTIKKIEEFKEKLQPHWTDVHGDRKAPEVDSVIAALKGGLGEIIGVFGDFSRELGISKIEMTWAREACVVHVPPPVVEEPPARPAMEERPAPARRSGSDKESERPRARVEPSTRDPARRAEEAERERSKREKGKAAQREAIAEPTQDPFVPSTIGGFGGTASDPFTSGASRNTAPAPLFTERQREKQPETAFTERQQEKQPEMAQRLERPERSEPQPRRTSSQRSDGSQRKTAAVVVENGVNGTSDQLNPEDRKRAEEKEASLRRRQEGAERARRRRAEEAERARAASGGDGGEMQEV